MRKPGISEPDRPAPDRPHPDMADDTLSESRCGEPDKHRAPPPPPPRVPEGLWPRHGWVEGPRFFWQAFHADPIASRLPERARLLTNQSLDPELARLMHWLETPLLADVVEVLLAPWRACRRRRCRRDLACAGFACGQDVPPCLPRLYRLSRDMLVILLGLTLDMRAFARADGDLFRSEDPDRRLMEDIAAGIIRRRPRPGHPGDAARIRRFLRARAAADAACPHRSQSDHESVITT